MSEYTPVGDVWLQLADDEFSCEANTFTDGLDYRIEWYHVDVGLVSAVHFLTLSECHAWYAENGYTDYSS